MLSELLNAALGLAKKIESDSLPINFASLHSSVFQKDLDFVFRYVYIKVVWNDSF